MANATIPQNKINAVIANFIQQNGLAAVLNAVLAAAKTEAADPSVVDINAAQNLAEFISGEQYGIEHDEQHEQHALLAEDWFLDSLMEDRLSGGGIEVFDA